MTAEDVVRLLKELISIPTVNDPIKGERVTKAQGELIQERLRRYGLEMDMLINNGYPSLLSVLGEGRPITLFLAHFDVVPPGPGWKITDPFKPLEYNGYIYGRGSADDKSNVAAITIALRNYKPRKGTVIIAFTGDEEIGGANGAQRLAEKLEREGMKPDYLVNGDGSLSRVIIRRRSAFTVELRVRAESSTTSGYIKSRDFETKIILRNTMHSAYFTPGVDTHALIEGSLWVRDNDVRVSTLTGEWVKNNVLPRRITLSYVDKGVGRVAYDEALTALVKVIVPITRTPIPTEKYSDYGVTINPNMYESRDNMHRLVVDIRAMTTNRDIIRRQLQETLRENLLDADLEVRGGVGYLYTGKTARIVRIASRINSSLGLPSEPIEAGGASDSRYFSPKGTEAIDYGPLGYNIHGPDERVSISHLIKAVDFYKKIAESIHG